MKCQTVSSVLLVTLLAPSLVAAARTQHPEDLVVDYNLFKEPPAEYRGHRWFTFRLSNINDNTVTSGIQQAAKMDSFGSFMITPDGGNTSALSDAYMKGSKRQPNTTGCRVPQ